LLCGGGISYLILSYGLDTAKLLTKPPILNEAMSEILLLGGRPWTPLRNHEQAPLVEHETYRAEFCHVFVVAVDISFPISVPETEPAMPSTRKQSTSTLEANKGREPKEVAPEAGTTKIPRLGRPMLPHSPIAPTDSNAVRFLHPMP